MTLGFRRRLDDVMLRRYELSFTMADGETPRRTGDPVVASLSWLRNVGSLPQANAMQAPSPGTAATKSLSRRELEVLELLARGTIDKEVGRQLGISLGTVRVYRRRIGEKMGVKGVVRSLLVAWHLGEIDLDAIAAEIAASRRTSSRPVLSHLDENSDNLDTPPWLR